MLPERSCYQPTRKAPKGQTPLMERLEEAGCSASVGSTGDSYDNALAETIHRLGLWKNIERVEYETLAWVEWFNNRRLLSSIGNVVPRAEFEENFYRQATIVLAA